MANPETNPLAYLDYNATAPLHPKVAKAVTSLWAEPLNGSSIHAYGRKAKSVMDDARRHVAALVGKDTSNDPNGIQVIFTASGTEANNLAIRGLKVVSRYVSGVEHPSVLKTAQSLADGDFRMIPVDKNGIVKFDVLERMLTTRKGKVLVSVMLANNETGVIQPMAEIAALARRYGALVHTDAVQAAGRIPLDMAALGVDMMTLSSHKLGGLQGAAALVIRKDLALSAQLIGGGQELGFRAGTENIPAIHGFGTIAALAEKEREALSKKLELYREALETAIHSISPEAMIVGKDAPRIPNTSCIIMPGVKAETQLIHYDMQGLSLSAGSACSSGKVEVSQVLKAMGYRDEEAACAIRVSLGRATTEEDIVRFADAWQALYRRLKTPQNKAA
ncbi:MAG: cysteine desulfurase [Rickettsiales bacterium]|jgi:cysteine desulfurase|nr:cysteine desulfurase [Rickettsiales bacterium]